MVAINIARDAGIDANNIVKTNNFYAPVAKNKSGEYKIKSGQIVYLCFSTDMKMLQLAAQ